MIAVLLATSSGAVALPILQSLGRSDRLVLITTAWIAIADVVTVLALPIVLATGGLVRVVTGGCLVVLAAGVWLVLAKVGIGTAAVQRMRRLSCERGWGFDLRISLLVLFTCAWIATRFGTSILIAGFAVGAVVAVLGEPRRVAQQLVGLGEGFLIPVFFVHLGTEIDFGALLSSPRSLVLCGGSPARRSPSIVAALVWRLHLGGARGLRVTGRARRDRVDRSRHTATHRRSRSGGDGRIVDHARGVRTWQCLARAGRIAHRRQRAGGDPLTGHAM